MRHHWPILRTALAASTPLVLVIVAHRDVFDDATLSLTAAAWFVIGASYTQLFEYWAHRVPMHRGMAYLAHVRSNHLEHHRVFHGSSFQTRNVADLEHIAGRFWVFPILFLGHYAVLTWVLAPAAVIAFLAGAVAHYLTFELTHWLTHIEDNTVDRAISHVPLLAGIRAYQIEHHRIHHETPVVAFNFNPPYLGDLITGHMPSVTKAWTKAPEVAPATVALPVTVTVTDPPGQSFRRHLVGYATAAVAGVALVGAVVVAHGLLSQCKRHTLSPEQIA